MKKQSVPAIESFEKKSTYQGGKSLPTEHTLRSNSSAGNIQCTINLPLPTD